MKSPILFLFLLITFSACNDTSPFMYSPNNNTKASIRIVDEKLVLQVHFNEDTIIKKLQPRLWINEEDILLNATLSDAETGQFNETYKTINGKNQNVLNQFNYANYELTTKDQDIVRLEVRLYDKGFAYRFIIPKGFKTLTESSLISFSEDHTFWAYNGENHNVGPVKLSASYKNDIVRKPVTFKNANNNYFAIHEAAIFEHEPFSLRNIQNQNTFELHQKFEIDEKPSKSSWRAFILGNRPGELIESNLLINLNEPCKIEDTSWIKPGRAMWDWRVWGYKTEDGFEYGLNTESHKRFIDFAAENSIQYLLIDADWYGPEFSADSDPTTTREGVDIEDCMAYAKEKGIGVILYLNDVGAKKFGLERVLKQFSEWGASGVKYGFMRGTAKEKVLNTRRIVELCAKYQLTVNFHDNPIAPSGDRRTWPNLITKEFGHSQADAKRSYHPETLVTAPFVNMLAGPLDLCNGWFSLSTAYGNGRVKVFEVIPGTVASEVAKLIVVYGGCFVLPDAPEEYLKKDDLFDCIRQMPAHFDSFKVLDGEIGEYISVARGSGDEWFVGSLSNREARTLEIDFDFLDDNKKYIATFYEDAHNTHYQNNKESYSVKKDIPIDKKSRKKIKIAPGGGNAIWIRPIN